MKRCKKCKSGCYCSTSCRNKNVPSHEKLCEAIQDLQVIENQKKVFSVRETGQVKVQNRLIRLIGEKPLLNCSLNGVTCEALWDTGSMVSLVNIDWVKENVPDELIQSVSEFLEGDNLHLCAANNTNVKVEGVVILKFCIGDDLDVPVPFLITKDKLTQPIIGYNVIEHVVLSDTQNIPKLMKKSFPVISKTNVESVINLIRTSSADPESSPVKTTSKTIIPPHSRCRIKCKTGLTISESEQAVVFQPEMFESELEFSESVSKVKLGRSPYIHIVVSNPNSVQKVIEKDVVVGVVEAVSAVIPIFPKRDNPKTKLSKTKSPDIADKSCSEKWLPKVDLSHLSKKKRQIVEEVLREECEVFARSEEDIGDVKDFEMEIILSDNVPVCVPHRQVPRPLYEEVKNYINDLIVNKWVRESKSPYSSPIVCVRKKDQSLRLCIDYRGLNKKIVPDKQPIPRIQELLDSLGGQKWFSTLDMTKAYHQGYVKEEFRKLTAFSTPWGLYEWIRIPMGISNAPPSFQRYINQVLIGLRDQVCISYLDDILVYGKSFKQHTQNLKLVLNRLKSRGIKLRADKCILFKQEVRYLGRLISKEGYRPDPVDTEALEKFRKPPKTIGELRTLLGFFGYYRGYVRDFAKKFKPIYDLLKTKGQSHLGKKSNQVEKRKLISWNSELQNIVDDVINYLKSPEVLVFPDYNLPFTVHCDASEKGLGAILYQKQAGKNRVISFASRTLSDPEKNYHLHSGKLEFLALKWAITEKFADYLCYGPPFVVYTDNNPLTYVLSSAKLNATGLRWVAELANFQFSIKYKPGKRNGDADGLSRQSDNLDTLEEDCTEVMKPESLSTVLSVSQNSVKPRCPEHINVNVLQLSEPCSMEPVRREEFIKCQVEDPVIGPVYKCITLGRRPSKSEWCTFGRKSKILMQQFSKLKLHNDLLIRETETRKQLILPEKFHGLVFSELHAKLGHLGADRVEELARQRFYWPYMRKDVATFLRQKCPCIASKKPNVLERAPLVPIVTTCPFEMICIDFLKLDVCKGGYQYVLVVTDHFSRFSQAYATKTKSSKVAATKLFDQYILQFGFPKRIHHDRGAEFNSGLFRELHRLAGIQISNTTLYHPMGDGQVERFNRTLCNMLKAIPESEKKNWKDYLPKLTFAYNSTINKTTGYSPFFLMFGRESRLPIDSIFPMDEVENKNIPYKEFVRQWEKSMKEAYKIADTEIRKSAAYNKKYYDKKIRYVDIAPGDRVLVRNVEKGGTGKLRSFWEQKIYVVVSKHELVPVYSIKPLNGKKIKIVHRNMLMKVNDLPLNTFTKDTGEEPKKPNASVAKDEVRETIQSSDEEEEEIIVEVRKADSDVERDEDPKVLINDLGEMNEEENVANNEDFELSSDDETFLGFEDSQLDEEEREEDEDETSEEDVPVIRRSNRQRKPRYIYTYDEIGKKPKISRYGNSTLL